MNSNSWIMKTKGIYFYRNNLSGLQEVGKNSISIFPNPVEDNLYILGLNNQALIGIYSIEGVLIKKEKVFDNKINVSDLTQGIYIINIIEKDRFIYSTRIIKK